MQAIDTFAQLHKLPRSIHHRVRAYYDYLLRNAVHDLDSNIVTSLSPQLRQDVLLFLYSDLVAKVPFFRNKSQQFIAELIQKLRAEVFPPGEFVTVEVLSHAAAACCTQYSARCTVRCQCGCLSAFARPAGACCSLSCTHCRGFSMPGVWLQARACACHPVNATRCHVVGECWCGKPGRDAGMGCAPAR